MAREQRVPRKQSTDKEAFFHVSDAKSFTSWGPGQRGRLANLTRDVQRDPHLKSIRSFAKARSERPTRAPPKLLRHQQDRSFANRNRAAQSTERCSLANQVS